MRPENILCVLTFSCFVLLLNHLKDANSSRPADGHEHNIPPTIRSFKAANMDPHRLLFEPGSLPLSKSQAIEQCYVGTKGNYEERSERDGSCVYSEKYSLLLVISGKTGSSTQRNVTKASFGGVGGSCPEFMHNDARRMVATRDPFDRFISAYKEMIIRLKLYKREMKPDAVLQVPSKYRRFANELKDLDGEDRVQMLYSSTPDNILFNTKLMETFVSDYDGENVFEDHLSLQMTKLWSHDKESWAMNHFDIVLETANLTAELAELARQTGAPTPKPLVARKSKFDMLNLTAVSDSTIQKICRLTARDYCCLNYKMPPACLRDDMFKGERVMCEWIPNEEGNANVIKSVLL